MTVQCVANSAAGLPRNYFDQGYTAEAEFALSVGKKYRVCAIGLWRGAIKVLLSDDNGSPYWFPNELFHIAVSALPHDWHCGIYSEPDNHLQAIWGYEAIVLDQDHNDALMERDTEALRMFYRQHDRAGVEPGKQTNDSESI